jgi:hypothetical protein
MGKTFSASAAREPRAVPKGDLDDTDAVTREASAETGNRPEVVVQILPHFLPPVDHLNPDGVHVATLRGSLGEDRLHPERSR